MSDDDFDEPTAPDTSRLHLPYVRAVADAVDDTTDPWTWVTTRLIQPTEPRSAALQVGTAQDGAPRDWLCWSERFGWWLGTDPDGQSPLTLIRWACMGPVPAPARVAAWLVDVMATPREAGTVHGPDYRLWRDHDETNALLVDPAGWD
ncbi:DUF6292 family protein [Saccharothrix lopnurensis]|uniref:DUF6292 family protein n=1 Tax=Saccharothrix lopnurensis TaxID=1670621 RepID=A0ABW1P2H6_9PSEU